VPGGEGPFAKPIGLFEIGVPRQDELIDPQVVVVQDPFRDLFVAADQGRPGAATHQPDACPQVWRHLETSGRPLMKFAHAPLAFGLAGGKAGLCRLDLVGVDGGEGTVCLGPRLP